MRRSGSITIWTALVLLLLLSLFFTMAEGVRYTGLSGAGQQALVTASDSLLAGYCRPLWEIYGILGADPARGRQELADPLLPSRQYLQRMTQQNLQASFFQIQSAEVSISAVGYLRDDAGSGLIRQAALAELAGVGDTLSGQVKESQKAESAAGSEPAGKAEKTDESGITVLTPEQVDAMIESGENAVSPEESNTPETSSDSTSTVSVKDEETLLSKILKWKQQAVLSQVLPDSAVPDGRLPVSFVSFAKRDVSSGTMECDAPNVLEQAVFRRYLTNRMSLYTAQKEGRALALETEYILCGKTTDAANLEGVVLRLLGLREVQNLAALTQDTGRSGQAEAIALSISAVAANPALLKPVKAAILAAWAYLESVLDVRALLAGQKISLLKNTSEWTSDITDLAACFRVETKAKPATGIGIDYAGYLMMLLALERPQRLADRTLEVMEAAVRRQEGYENLRMDRMVCAVRTTADYQATPLFLAWVTVGELSETGYHWTTEYTSSYQ